MLINPRPTYLLIIPLVLSAFTHLWNPLGFPSFWYVEEIYLQRAMYVLHGLGTTDPSTTYGHPYDHPYFGQLLLAGLLKIINYPDSLDLSASIPSSQNLNDSSRDFSNSVNLLHFIPRLLIGSLAIIDTFLIYKISEHSVSQYHCCIYGFHSICCYAYDLVDEEDTIRKSSFTPFTFINIICGLLQEKHDKQSLPA